MGYVYEDNPNTARRKETIIHQRQESTRQDVERDFGMLQSRFAIIREPTRGWQVNIVKDIIYACIILHNMIVEDERHTHDDNFEHSYGHLDNAM